MIKFSVLLLRLYWGVLWQLHDGAASHTTMIKHETDTQSTLLELG